MKVFFSFLYLFNHGIYRNFIASSSLKLNQPVVTLPLLWPLSPSTNPSAFGAHRTRSEMKYCSGGFHGSDNLFGNMQVSGGGAGEREAGLHIFHIWTRQSGWINSGGFCGAQQTTVCRHCWSHNKQPRLLNHVILPVRWVSSSAEPCLNCTATAGMLLLITRLRLIVIFSFFTFVSAGAATLPEGPANFSTGNLKKLGKKTAEESFFFAKKWVFQ